MYQPPSEIPLFPIKVLLVPGKIIPQVQSGAKLELGIAQNQELLPDPLGFMDHPQPRPLLPERYF